MAYPTTAQLVSASSVEALTGLSTPEQDSLRDAAIAQVEDYCHQSFLDENGVTKIVSGTGAMYAILPRRLRELDTLTINGVAVDVTLVGINDRANKLYFKSLTGLSYYEKAMLDLHDEVLHFSSGIENVAVAGDWGWATVPPAVAVALRYDMEDSALAEQSELGPTIAAYRKLGLKDASQGNLSVSMHDEAPALTSRVRNLLVGDLIWHDPAGIVV